MSNTIVAVGDVTDANKTKHGRADALALAKSASRLVVAKGKKVVDVDPRKASDDEMAALMLGPTGNLRAPTIKKGKTVYVGFSEEAYRELTA